MTLVFLWGLAALLTAVVALKFPERLRKAWRISLKTAPTTLIVVCMAIVASGFLAALLPTEVVARHMGEGSGVSGILVASALGAFLPGGPMVAFPLVITLARGEAGEPQLVALLSSWSVIAIHRLIAWELPLLGAAFAFRRIVTSFLFPPLIGLIAAALFSILSPGLGGS